MHTKLFYLKGNGQSNLLFVLYYNTRRPGHPLKTFITHSSQIKYPYLLFLNNPFRTIFLLYLK